MKCSRCGEEYEKDEVCITFADIDRVPVDMCENCLEEAYENGESGLFFDTCEECGCSFDVVEEDEEYNSRVSSFDGCGRDDFGRVLCADCALEERENI